MLPWRNEALAVRWPDDDPIFSSRDQISPIGAPLDVQDALGMLIHDGDQHHRLHVPNSDAMVIAATCEAFAIWLQLSAYTVRE